MDFYKWHTTLDEAVKCDPTIKRFSRDVRLREYITFLSRENTKDSEREKTKLVQECLWERGGKPYYNIHPQAASHLCKARMENISASMLEVPADFPAVNIRLAEEHPDLSIEPGKLFIQSILFAWGVWAFMAEKTFPDVLMAKNPQHIPRDRQLTLLIDTGERNSEAGTRHWGLFVSTDNENTLEAEFLNTIQLMETHDFERACPGTRLHEVLLNCLRLVATVGFMANCTDEEFLEYEVIAKHRAKFGDADDATKKKLIDKARRRGKVGWNIGTNKMFIGSPPANASPGPKGKYELQSAHIRTGHLHAVRYGPGKKKVRIQWFRPTVVRPDLGFSEE